jgi:hypothetical protein
MFIEHCNGNVSTLECGHVCSSEQPSGKRKEILLQILESLLPKLSSLNDVMY